MILARAAAAAAIALTAGSAHADLASDVDELASAFGSHGRVVRLPPVLAERGELRPVRLAEDLVDGATKGCTSVAILGAPSSTFVLRFLPDPRGRSSEGDGPAESVRGAAQLVRCGARKVLLARLVIEMRSVRGVLEGIAVSAAKPSPVFTRFLPQRDPGPFASDLPAPRRVTPAPIGARIAAVRARRARAGASVSPARVLEPESDGSASVLVQLDPGCHFLDVLGERVPRGRNPDIDAGVRAVSDESVLAIDETHSVDAALEFCVAAPEVVRLQVRGVEPSGDAIVVHSNVPLPDGLPARWVATTRARLASAIRSVYSRSLGGAPIYTSLGALGSTDLPVEVEPGACYVAAVAASHGEAASLGLEVDLGAEGAANEAVVEPVTGTAVLFCSQSETIARLLVEARGDSLGWTLAVWRTTRVPVGETFE